MGRRIERGSTPADSRRRSRGREAATHDLDVMLDLINSQITYRSRYADRRRAGAGARPGAARPLQSTLGRLPGAAASRAMAALPMLRQDGIPEEPMRLAARLSAELETEVADRLDDDSMPRPSSTVG